MASSLNILLPATRSGRTFFFALAVLGAAALVQLLALGGYLLRGGIAPRAAPIHFAESSAEAPANPVVPLARLQSSWPTPAPAPAIPAESTIAQEAPVMTHPTPAPAARYSAGTGDLLEQARQLRTRGDMNSALARLREAQVADPDNPQIVAEVALTYEAMQMPDRAFEQWQQLYNLGEGVGALYYLADSKLHAAPASTLQVLQGTANPAASSGQGAAGVGDAVVLKLTDINKEDVTDPSVEQKVSLKIVVKNRPGVVIDPNKVRILTYFYDLVDGKDIVLTDAETDFKWLTPAPVNWANDKSEVLETTYVRPKAAPVPVPAKETEAASHSGRGRTHRGKGDGDVATPIPSTATGPVRTYLGYTVRLYYDRQLQDAQADPVKLMQQFPPPATLPSE